MSDHIIECTEAVGYPVIPSISVNESIVEQWVAYTFPASQQKIAPNTKFVVKFNRPIDLTKIDTTNFKIEQVVSDSPLQVTELVDIFEDIDTTEDYDSISRTLVLTLTEDLSQLENYFFTVRNLTDTLSNSQIVDHIILFQTGVNADSPVIPAPLDIDTVIVEDYTLISPPIPLGAATSSVSCSIPDGSLNIPVATDEITISFTEAVDVSLITLTEENLTTGIVTNLTPTVSQDGSTFLVTISLDEISTGVYLNTNCIYSVGAIYTTFEFATAMSPFYVPLNAFTPYTAAAVADPITWVRIVYEFSAEVRARLGSGYLTYEQSKANELRQFTKYYILSAVDSYSNSDGFLLGELQITSSYKSGSTADYKSMADMWETRLFGRLNTVKSADPYSPRYNVRRNETRKSMYKQDWDTFNRKLY